MRITFLAATILTGPLAGSATAHEYWIEPLKFTVETGEAISAHLKNGQDFRGVNYSFIPSRFEQFTITGPDDTIDVDGRVGDLPAVNTVVSTPGLYSIAYQGTFDRITFKEEAKIRQYIDYEGLDGAFERHLERGLAPDRFEEAFARCAKALVQVGEIAENEDRLLGLKYEWVAEANPYTLAEDQSLPVRLYWEGEPAANKHVNVFRVADKFELIRLQTDGAGRVEIPLAGGGKFMINSVMLLEGDDDPETETPEWISYWASLTFGLGNTDEILTAE